MNGSATQYEIINKTTGEIFPVDHLGSGDENHDGVSDFITHKDGEEIVFTNPGYVNETYIVRAVDTKLSPNGVDPVADIVIEAAAEVTEEVAPVATEEGEATA